ncbi:hypothetical protein TTHERM_00195840 (macronuclear) [Tetrahymena thermophila SB210]|uniref:Uncharacterized protein n=1 Tax=Tetrahymena thermophila (strain SB210) TaxID=312017 RepID=Q23K50_TETTS|nr:hypothetical protein TTHERM_00195840 [Tetrahymena thermophila SB210]EAR96993.4 hypothetical protein TTHERM_00195840 [Tetrahymena thermophila SB210]|eukprot:XP_001017238.4 hypothetical protein TTHERM_00195840 [Tetrahymena thermophila SB210]
MQTNQKTEESLERPQYRIRNSTSQQLKQTNRNRDSPYIDNTKDIKTKNQQSNLTLKNEAQKLSNQKNNANQLEINDHLEKVAFLLKKINGNEASSIKTQSSVSSSNVLAKRQRGELNQRLNTTTLNNLSNYNNYMHDSKILDKSMFTKQQAVQNTNSIGSISILKGGKQKQTEKSRILKDGQDNSVFQNQKYSQQTRFASMEEFQPSQVNFSVQDRQNVSIAQQLQLHLQQSAQANQNAKEYINVQPTKNNQNQANIQIGQIRRTLSEKQKNEGLQIEETLGNRELNQRFVESRESQNLQEEQEEFKDFNVNDEDTYKIDYLNTNFTNKSQYTSKNLFTNSDSRFKQINQLKQKNSYLENIISELKSEINEVDEFKAVLDKFESKKNRNEDELISSIDHEKRIMLLKAQIHKQQRHIKQLNLVLNSSRKCFKEVLDVCYFLLDNITTEKNVQFNSQSQHKSSMQNQLYYQKGVQKQNNSQSKQQGQNFMNQGQPIGSNGTNINNINQPNSGNQTQRGSQNVGDAIEPNLPKTEEAMQVFFNQISQNQAHKQLYSVLIGVEDRRKFVDNFNAAFSKVMSFQYKSEEFKKLFSIKRNKHTQQAEIKFNHPIRLFFDQFHSCFPVHTLFDYLDSTQQQNTHNKLVTIMSLLRKTDRAFKKIKTYQLFKHNPICFREQGGIGDISIPNLLLENQKLFSDFLQSRGYQKTISLNFDRIMKVESSLGQLLDKIQSHMAQLQLRGEYSQELSDLVQNLRKGCEDLLCLGVMIPNDQGSFQQRVAIMAEKEQKKFSTQIDSQMSLDLNQNQSQNPGIEWFNYDQKMDLHTEFNEKKAILSIFFDELSSASSVKDYKTCSEIILKIGTLLDSIKNIFEIKENVIKLKDFEIAYLKNQQAMRVADQQAAQEFIEQIQGQIHQLLQPINQKLNIVVNAFTQLIDHSNMLDIAQRQNLIYTFKKNMKEILENIKRILTNQFQNNQINILTLEQQFQQRVSVALQRYNKLKPIISKTLII